MSLVDLSAGGVQVQFEDFWLRPGSTVVVEIVGGETELAIPSRVVRCHVAEIEPAITYRGALEFKRILDLPEPPKGATADGRVANPVSAHARLALALRRLDSPASGEPRIVDPHAPTGDNLAALGAGAMIAVLAMLDTPASRRAGAPFARELSGLFSDIAHGLEQGESPQELTTRIERRLGRAIRARSLRVWDGLSVEGPQLGSDLVCFDAPSLRKPHARKILVEFASGAAPQEWQFQLLKAGGHLIALIDELEERRRAAKDAENIRSAGKVQAGWSKLVARFADGRLLKGYCHDFHPPRGHFQLWPSLTATADCRVLVPIGHLKAVFFVRDFEGNPEYKDDKNIEAPGHGRKLAVRFLDDEELVGTTLSYRPDGAGFYVTPCDPKSNNLRIFVSNQAVRHVRFL